MSPEVVIVGAGVVGCATAYYLAREGVKVTVVERDSVASHASGFALGALNPLSGVGIPDPLGPLALESFRLHRELAPQLKEETGIDTQFELHATATVAFSQEQGEQMWQRLPWQQAQAGFRVEWRSAEELLALEPRLTPRIAGGVLTQQVGLVEPYLFCLALLEAAEKMGATLRHGQARGVRFQGDRVAAVELAREELSCDTLVMATGPWAGDAGPWIGVDLPVTPLKGELLRLRVDGAPLTYVSWPNSYAISKPDGLVWVGTTEEDAGFDERPSPEARQDMMERAVEVLPYLADAQIVRQTACLRPVSADGLPILGRVPDREGIIIAAGAGRKGILFSPIMGRVAADLVARGTTDYDISALEPGREITSAQVAVGRSEPFRF